MSSLLRFAAVVVLCASLAPCWGAKICIDAGHGGTDPGATNGCYGGSNYEKTNVLNKSLKFRDWLNLDTNDPAGGGSWSVVMCRSTDVFVSLQGRCDIANNNACDRFMCIHNNAATCAACGTECFSYSGTGTAATLRNQLQNRMIQAWGRPNRGNKTYGFYVLVHTNMAAELAETAFVDAPIDNPYVSGSANQDRMAEYHMYAIQDHYGIPAYKPGTGGTTLINDAPACSSNWATGTSAADKYGADYRYRSTAALSDQAGWTINVGTAGNYDISAWWSAGTNRTANDAYKLPPDNQAIYVNQQANGGKWNLLGTKSLAAGNNTTYLSCWATTGFVAIADAVKYYGPK